MKQGHFQRCESPDCSVEFEPSGPKVRPKRFCSGQCAVEMSLIRRAAKLLNVLSDFDLLKVIRGAIK
jgi:hypothetical protein